MKKYELIWHGPFSIYGPEGTSIFEQAIAWKTGIYLWAIKHNDSYLVDSVGETGRSFAQRTKEHTLEYLSGNYRVLDPDLLAKGIREYLWEGLWRKGRRYNISEFIYRQAKLVPPIHKLLKLYRLFLAPLEIEDSRIRKRIEAALAHQIKASSQQAAEFFDDAVTYQALRWDGEEELLIRIKSPVTFIGMPKELKI